MAGQQPPRFQPRFDEGPGWETMAEDLQYANPYLQVYLTRVRTPSRPEGSLWTVVHRKSAVVIAPMTPDGSFLLIRQERIPIRAAIWEFPAGQIDTPVQSAEVIHSTASRELLEETGYELGPGGKWVPIGRYFSSPGFTDENCHLFLARGVVPSAAGAKPDEHEAIQEVRAFSPADLRQMVASGEIRDANTLTAFARMCALGFI
jgi:ADP-ribose pyrophosphatase